VDIREGMQEGCISCGMCIDACDSIMDKVDRPRGLIRYASEKEMMGISLPPLIKRPRVIAYSSIFLLAVAGIIYGLSHIPPVELSVVHERQPLFIQMSNGDIHNKYTIKAINKTLTDMHMKLSIDDAHGVEIVGGSQDVVLQAGRLLPFSVFLSAKPDALKEKKTRIQFILENVGAPAVKIKYKSVFMSPIGR